jgi:hypothetical protein
MNEPCYDRGKALRLQVVRRPTTTGTEHSHSHRNHFVRLAPQTAQRLRDIALSNVFEGHESLTTPRLHLKAPPPSQKQQQQQQRWWIHQASQIPVSTKCESGIDFLPLAITFEETGKIIYASYNGGMSNLTNRTHNNNNHNHAGKLIHGRKNT